MEPFGRRTRRSLGAVLVGLIALAAVATAMASHPTVTYSSPFNSTNENWHADDGAIKSTTWQASGGNPGGYITSTFATGDGLVESVPNGAGSTWPAANALGDYGGTLGADVRVHLDGTTASEHLYIGLLSSNFYPCVFEDMGAPTDSWATYTVTLNTSDLVNCLTGKLLTGAQASAALAGFESIFITALNQDSVSETVDVDNAELTPPEAPATPPTGKVARSFLLLAHKAHKLSGWFTAPDDYSCAEKAKLTLFEKGKKPKKVGTVYTSSTMLPHYPATTFSFKLKRGAKGTFYVRAGKTTSKLDGNSCTAAKSKSVKVR